jgi:Mn-containing catalase
MIGGNVTNDFLDNLGAEQHRKITPETYEKMNEEFEEEGLAFRIIVPTQEQIDDWQNK